MNSNESVLIDEINEKVQKLLELGLDMNTIKRLLVENFKILDRFPVSVGDYGVKYEVLQVAESGVKLPKLSVLKGIKPFGSIGFGGKQIKCQYFVIGNDCYIKHMDYFSPILNTPEDFGADLNTLSQKYLNKERTSKFIYNDAWGEIVLQRKAWIKISNFVVACTNMHQIKTTMLIVKLQELWHFEECELDPYFEIFWGFLVDDYYKKTVKPLSEQERWNLYMDGLHSICRKVLDKNNLGISIDNCKDAMMMWSLEQTILPAVMNQKGFPMFFDNVIRDIYKEAST